MMEYLTTMAQTPDTQVSGAWVLELVAKIFVGMGAVAAAAWAAYRKGQASPAMETTIKSPVPTVTIRQEQSWASREELAALKTDVDELRVDVDSKLDKILDGQAEERRVAREALGKVHLRADKTSEALAEVRGELKQISSQMARLLDLATKRTGR